MFDNKLLQIITSIISPLLSFFGLNLRDHPIRSGIIFIIFFATFLDPDISVKFIILIFMILLLGFTFCCFLLYKINVDTKKVLKKQSAISKKALDLQKNNLNKEIEINKLNKRYDKLKKRDKKNNKIRKNITKIKNFIFVIWCFFLVSQYKTIAVLANKLVDNATELFNESADESSNTDADIDTETESDTNTDIHIDTNIDIETETDTNIDIETETDTDIDIETETDIDTETDIGIVEVKLKLEFPDGHPEANDNEIDQLYNLLFYPNEEDLYETISSDIFVWINSCEPNIPLNNAVTSSGKTPDFYSKAESDLLNGITVSSHLLEEIINGRKELLELFGNGKVSWLLSNNYQMYALNYLNQTKEANSIVYFYMKSIYYAKESLRFNKFDDNIDKYEIINYIKCRYKDIGDCDIIDDKIGRRAYVIYDSLNHALDQYYNNSIVNEIE